jgi:hypothetical protein
VGLFPVNPSDQHVFLGFERYGNNVRAVQILAENSGTDGIAVQPYQKIEQGRPVADMDFLPVNDGAENFF